MPLSINIHSNHKVVNLRIPTWKEHCSRGETRGESETTLFLQYWRSRVLRQAPSRVSFQSSFRDRVLSTFWDFSARQYTLKVGEVVSLKPPSTRIKRIIHMIEAHRVEGKVKFTSLELLLRNAKHVQLRWSSFNLEEILGDDFRWCKFSVILPWFFSSSNSFSSLSYLAGSL